MTTERSNLPMAWARLRFTVVSDLLSCPPARGELGAAIRERAAMRWEHPATGEWITFGASTIERWYYAARDAADPVAVLLRQVRSDRGRRRVLTLVLLAALQRQYTDHRKWSYTLHSDNLAALAREQPELGPAVSYSTVRRTMRARGWTPRRGPRNPTPGQRRAAERLEQREVRSYEKQHVHALWHYDFHEGRVRVVDSRGGWHTPMLFAVLDDCSRWCVHAQWYLDENSENLVHGLSQGILKNGLPRATMQDNGGAMRAQETKNGLQWFGIADESILAYSPYQNGKIETFWTQVEGRLLAMLDRTELLTLDFLNRGTAAWVAMEYNRSLHEDLGTSPLDRLLERPNVSRKAPDPETLRIAFSYEERRTQRRSDGTVSRQERALRTAFPATNAQAPSGVLPTMGHLAGLDRVRTHPCGARPDSTGGQGTKCGRSSSCPRPLAAAARIRGCVPRFATAEAWRCRPHDSSPPTVDGPSASCTDADQSSCRFERRRAERRNPASPNRGDTNRHGDDPLRLDHRTGPWHRPTV